MEDKYKELRDNLAVLHAEIRRKGGGINRSQMILDLLEERDQLAAAARVAERKGKAFKDLPLCVSQLSFEEKIRLDENLKHLLAFLGSPGDWGYETQLGRLTVCLDEARRALWVQAEVA